MDEFWLNVESAAEHYSESTGIGCFAIDSEGGSPCGCSDPQAHDFCSQFSEKLKTSKLNCSQVHRYGSLQAERFGGKYMFFCPMSLLHWVSPVFYRGRNVGSLIAGPALIIDSEDFIKNDLVSSVDIPSSELFGLMKLASTIPSITTQRARSLSELLFLTATGVSEQERAEISLGHEDSEQQKEIYAYLEYIKRMESGGEEYLRYPFEKEIELTDFIQNGESDKARAALNEILGNIFFSSGGDLKIIKARVLELVVLLSRAAVRGGGDAELILGMNYQYIGRIGSFENIESIASWLSRVISRFAEIVFDMRDIKHADAIQKAMQFIRDNYHRKISLEDTADYVKLSPSYLSKLFKKELSQNFNTYLNEIRVDKSGNLLLNTDLQLIDIAGICGFEDQSYFTKVFKKYKGMSPGKYRENRGRRQCCEEIHSV